MLVGNASLGVIEMKVLAQMGHSHREGLLQQRQPFSFPLWGHTSGSRHPMTLPGLVCNFVLPELNDRDSIHYNDKGLPLRQRASSISSLHAITDGFCQFQTNFDDGLQLLAEIRAADVKTENKESDCMYSGVVKAVQGRVGQAAHSFLYKLSRH